MWKRIFAACLAALTAAALLVSCGDKGNTPTLDDGSNNNDGGLEDLAPTVVESGKVGDSEVTWELQSDGTLYIAGTGEMGEMVSNSAISTRQPWNDYIANDGAVTIKKLVVKDGVTALSEGAFQGCINLESAEIASSVTAIPYQCFSRCSMLRTVRAKGVIMIEDFAFQFCSRLATVTFSASLEVVWDGAFFEVATQSGSFAVRLAGDAAEWSAAQAKMQEIEDDDLAIFESGNERFIEALENVTFVGK